MTEHLSCIRSLTRGKEEAMWSETIYRTGMKFGFLFLSAFQMYFYVSNKINILQHGIIYMTVAPL